jgi:hypothetical protein
LNGNVGFTAPSLTCCLPRDSPLISNSLPECACASGSWLFESNCVSCPFGGSHIRSIITGGAHSIVQTTNDLWWSFGLNSAGQLLRSNPNLGNANPNPDVQVIPKNIYGDSNQPFIYFSSGSTADHSLTQTYRDFCTPGNHSIDRRSPCTRCTAGSFSSSKGALTKSFYSMDQSVVHPHSVRFSLKWLPLSIMLNCPVCGAGNSSKSEADQCSPCPPGTYSFGGASTCHKCGPGTYSNGNSSGNCTLCDLGKSSLFGDTVCFDCPLGKYSQIRGSEECLACARGTYARYLSTSTCEQCGVYEYQNLTGSSACISCPVSAPTTAQLGAASINNCQTLCLTGKFGDVLGASTASMRNCRPCPFGYYGYNDDIVGGSGATFCRKCVPGKYSPQENNGYERESGSPTCTACVGGKYAPATNTTACLACPEAKYSPGGSSACYNCLPGTYSLGNQINCTQCLPGQYNPWNMSTQCWNCSAGTSSNLGATSCLACSPGRYSLVRASSCTFCSSGLHQPNVGQSLCLSCLPGKFSSGGAIGCSDCRPGNYSWGPLYNASKPGFGAEICSKCPIGTFSSSNGASNCSFCLAGKACNNQLRGSDARGD